ncbi:MAG: hypothetical protein C0603_06190 [Denitrovibrio sp.]|nr:MAG: hypothetical protein C0603_06190 [Denitrovibrio sp.]
MRLIIYFIIPFVLFGCGTDFFLNKEPLKQLVVLTQNGQSLELQAKSLIEDNVTRMQLVSDFYRGDAEIVFENGEYHMNYTNLPISEDKIDTIKGDLYAALYAGDYPFHSDYKMYGESILSNGIKTVKDTDGYVLYKIIYNGKEIRLKNVILEYAIIIYSDKELGK